jgi:integrase
MPITEAWPTDARHLAGEEIGPAELLAAFAAADGPRAEVRVVLWAWCHDPHQAPLTQGRLAELAVRFGTRLEATGVESLLDATASEAAAFVRAPVRRGGAPSAHTMHLRRTALRAIYRTLHQLGVHNDDPTVFLELPSRWFRAVRPLTDAELHQARTAVMARRGDPPAGSLLLALAETGAATVELTRLRWCDVHAQSATLPGGTRILPRTAGLTDWGERIVARARDDPDPRSLVVSGSARPPGSQPAIAAMTNRLHQILRTAELHRVDGIGPRSIRLWAAATAYSASGRVESAAHVLGIRSLDAASAAIGI